MTKGVNASLVTAICVFVKGGRGIGGAETAALCTDAKAVGGGGSSEALAVVDSDERGVDGRGHDAREDGF